MAPYLAFVFYFKSQMRAYYTLNRVGGPTSRLLNRYENFDRLIAEVNKHEIPDDLSRRINKSIENLNALEGSPRELIKAIRRTHHRILKMLSDEMQLVCKNHYRNLWTGYGIAWGIPIGVVFGIAVTNMAFIGIGIPIGLAIGIAIGTEKDNKAKVEGRQLDVQGDLEL
jgi:hypothetical protein